MWLAGERFSPLSLQAEVINSFVGLLFSRPRTGKTYTEKTIFCISFQIEWDMIVGTVFLSILNIMDIRFSAIWWWGVEGGPDYAERRLPLIHDWWKQSSPVWAPTEPLFIVAGKFSQWINFSVWYQVLYTTLYTFINIYKFICIHRILTGAPVNPGQFFQFFPVEHVFAEITAGAKFLIS